MSSLMSGLATVIIPGLSQLRSGNFLKAATIFATALVLGVISGGVGWFLGGIWSLIDSPATSPTPRAAQSAAASTAATTHAPISNIAQWVFKFALLAVCAGIALYSISRGRALQSMEFLGIKMSFESSLGDLAKKVNDTPPRETTVEKGVDPAPPARKAEAIANHEETVLPRTERAAQITKPEAELNISGTWMNPEGASYEIVHSGESVHITEFSKLYFIPVQTAECEGRIQGLTINAQCTTFNGMAAVAQLSVRPDGRSITGAFQSAVGNVRIPVALSR